MTKIAIIGGGISGLAAAWRLSQKYDVVLYEKSNILGGHLKSLNYHGKDGEDILDCGVQIFHNLIYGNLLELFKETNVEVEPIREGLTLSTTQDNTLIWASHVENEFKVRMRPEIIRFDMLLNDVLANPEAFIDYETFHEFLIINNFSQDFIKYYLSPILSVLHIITDDLFEEPLFAIAFAFKHLNIMSVMFPLPFLCLKEGGTDYLNKFVKLIKADLRTSTAVQSVRREKKNVCVKLANGHVEYFDQVVFAVKGDEACQLIEDKSDSESHYLESIKYHDTKTIVHTDASVMSGERDSWTSFVYDIKEGMSFAHYYLPKIQNRVKNDIFVTLKPPENLSIAKDKIICEFNWRHLAIDVLHLLRVGELYKIQGKNRTWFCGEYTTIFNGHEGSFVSGLAIAEALGVPYPFKDKPYAAKMYYQIASYLLKEVKTPKEFKKSKINLHWPTPLIKYGNEIEKYLIAKKIEDEFKKSNFTKILVSIPILGKIIRKVIAANISVYTEQLKLETKNKHESD